MPKQCCIETYKKLQRGRELVDHWEGKIDLLESDQELLEKEYNELKEWREEYYKKYYKNISSLSSGDMALIDPLARYELLRAHKEGKINLLVKKVEALLDESKSLTEWMKDFIEDE